MAFTLAQKKIAAGTAARPSFSKRCAVVPRAAITLKDPPFALDALEGKGMSKSTLEYHWGECLTHPASWARHPPMLQCCCWLGCRGVQGLHLLVCCVG
jgi:hypothetical protein